MTTYTPEHDAGERRSFALIFLISFALLSLVCIGLLFVQLAQVLTRTGTCTILSSKLTPTAVNDGSGQNDGTLYYVSFIVSLQTPDGQYMLVPGYYSSSNYNFGDKASAQSVLTQYPPKSVQACSYTYLDPSGTKVLFAPVIPLEGILFASALLIIALVLTSICIVALRRQYARRSLAMNEQETLAGRLS